MSVKSRISIVALGLMCGSAAVAATNPDNVQKLINMNTTGA